MSKRSAIILGGGMVGSAMAMDLANDDGLSVTLADVRPEALARAKQRFSVQTVEADLSDPAEIRRVVADHDIVLGALSSVMGLAAMRAVIEAGKNYCDISFMAEDPADELSPLAQKHGVTVVFDCGVAPGMSNLLAGHATTLLEPCEKLEIYVGGLPQARSWPYEYKAGFDPHDAIEEYVRPARIVHRGKVVVREALSDPEFLEFEGIGTLEAFNTDGLRSLTYSLDVPDMIEKTMRYPGHIELMRIFRETGFFSKEQIDVGGVKVRPLDVTAAVMFPKWGFGPGEGDLTIMRLIARGQADGGPRTLTWELVDRYDPVTDTRSMSRTTGFPCTIMARLILDGRFDRKGVFAPEIPGKDPAIVETMLAQLQERGVEFRSQVS